MDAAADPPDTRTPGQVLAEERERQGLSRTDAAQRLHMSAYQIEALETGEYERLPKGPFLRGFVRNYAKMLGLDPEAVLSRIAEAAPQSPAPRIVVPSQNIRFDPLSDRFSSPYMKAFGLSVVALALGFATLYWWFFIKPTPPAQQSARKPAAAEGTPQNIAQAPLPPPEPVTPVNAPTEPLPPGAASPVAGKPSTASPPPSAPRAPEKTAPEKTAPEKGGAEKAAAEKAAPSSASVGSGPGQFRFAFRGDSWVEIRDARGEVIVSRLNAAGSELTARGQPPFQVIVGNAPDVQLTYNGRDFPLAPHTKVAVARFKVE